jgi:hypothetical protein
LLRAILTSPTWAARHGLDIGSRGQLSGETSRLMVRRRAASGRTERAWVEFALRRDDGTAAGKPTHVAVVEDLRELRLLVVHAEVRFIEDERSAEGVEDMKTGDTVDAPDAMDGL